MLKNIALKYGINVLHYCPQQNVLKTFLGCYNFTTLGITHVIFFSSSFFLTVLEAILAQDLSETLTPIQTAETPTQFA